MKVYERIANSYSYYESQKRILNHLDEIQYLWLYPSPILNSSDVLAEIDSKNRVDIREEEPEGTALRILGMLRILKYKPPIEISVAIFRQGLVEGQKHVIYPVMEWLLQRIEDLKTRAYLAKYLVKIEIPTEVAADADVAELYEQYEEHINQFKVRFKNE